MKSNQLLTQPMKLFIPLKGTAVFLSDNMVQPVIKLNEYLAGLKKVADIFNPKKAMILIIQVFKYRRKRS